MARRPHPSGYPEAHDAPAFIAPPLELRQAVEAVKEGAVEDAVAFTLAFTIIERVRSVVGGDSRDAEETALHQVAIHEEAESESTSPEFAPPAPVGLEPELDTMVDLPRVEPPFRAPPESERTLERDPYKDSGEETLQGTERDTLRQQLLSIGVFDGAPDLHTDRSSSARVLLGRSRAIRFRLALLDAWPEDRSLSQSPDEDLDLLLHPAIVVALADGASADERTGVGSGDAELVRTLVIEARTRVPQTTRTTFREAGAAAFARVTLLGTQRSIAYLHDRFREWPSRARRDALAVAARAVAGKPSRDPGVQALQMLEDAIG